MGRFFLLGFRQAPEVVAFGKLERRVMEFVWQRGAATSVRDIHAEFSGDLAYTTLMTTLDRLYKKGVLDRKKEGRAFLYSPRVSREDFEDEVRGDLLHRLLGTDQDMVPPALSFIVDAVSQHDANLLDELDRLVKEKQRALRRKWSR